MHGRPHGHPWRSACRPTEVSGVQIRLLGPVDIAAPDGPREVPGPRRKAILAVLGLHAGDVVSTDQLIDVVWGERAAGTGLNTIQSHMSALRRGLGISSAIVARPPGYALDLPGEPTDVATAERLVHGARRASEPARRVELLHEALALWRGRPLLDVAGLPWLAEQSERLAALQTEAQRALIDARLALGEHRQLLPELRRLAALHPFDEQLQGQLVLALYRAGRQCDALAMLRHVRDLLATELGIDPGPALRELEAGILRQDAALTPPQPRITLSPPPPGSLPPGCLPSGSLPSGFPPPGSLVGRARELAALTDGLGAGGPPIVGVLGDPGIGRTRILTEFAAVAERAGWSVLWGAGCELERAVPYGVFTNAVEDHLRALEPGRLAGLGAEGLRLLRYVCPAQNAPGESWTPAPAPALAAAPAPAPAPHPAAAPAGAERHRLHRAVRAVLELAAPPAGLLLVLDDVHLVDARSVELLDHLIRNPPSGPVLIAVGYRPRQLPARLLQALADAAQRGRARLVQLGPLTAGEAAGLLPPGTDPARAAELYQAGGGNPGYLTMLAGGFGREPSTGAADASAVLAGVPAAFAAELACLDRVHLSLAHCAAVAGATFDAHLIACVAGRPLGEVLVGLDELTRCDLVRPAGGAGVFGFRHPLARRAVYLHAGAGWRVAAHARAAAELRRRGAPVSEQAPHVEMSAGRGDLSAVDLLERAAAEALQAQPGDAAGWLRAALRLLPDVPESLPIRIRLLGTLVRALDRCHRSDERRKAMRDLLTLIPSRMPERRADALLSHPTRTPS